jgi:hypothetical protein
MKSNDYAPISTSYIQLLFIYLLNCGYKFGQNSL